MYSYIYMYIYIYTCIYIYMSVRTSTVLLIRTLNPMELLRVRGVRWNLHQIKKLKFLVRIQI